jgi:hypothetical protein
MAQEFSIREWQKKWNEGYFLATNVQRQMEAGWFDWFCKDASLFPRLRKLAPRVCALKDNPKFNLDKTYVFFKNNCPVVGPLYDDYRICNIETGEVIFTISCNDKRAKHHYEVWGKPKTPVQDGISGQFSLLFSTNSTRELDKWLNGEVL